MCKVVCANISQKVQLSSSSAVISQKLFDKSAINLKSLLFCAICSQGPKLSVTCKETAFMGV